jgi:hypothetical protein
MKKIDITPALNLEILARVDASFKGLSNVTKKQFNAAFKAEVQRAGFDFKYYNSVMKKIGPQF